MSLLDALNPSVIVPKKLKAASEQFAKECGVQPHEIRIEITFNEKTGEPCYAIFYVGVSETGNKKWIKKRAAMLDEII